MKVSAILRVGMITVFAGLFFGHMSIASIGDCDELLGGNCRPVPKFVETALVSEPAAKPAAKPDADKGIPIIALADTVKKREAKLNAFIEKKPKSKNKAKEVPEHAHSDEVKSDPIEPVPYPKVHKRPDVLKYPDLASAAPPKVRLADAGSLVAKPLDPLIMPTHRLSQRAVNIPNVSDLSPSAQAPVYQPAPIVELETAQSSFLPPAKYIESIRPSPRRIELQVAELMQDRQPANVSVEFRQLETRAENECLRRFGGRAVERSYFMSCMGETVGGLVYASRRPDLIGYFEALLN